MRSSGLGFGEDLPPLTDDERATVEANLGLVWRIVTLTRIPDLEADDAFQDGVLGLMRAAQLFDPSKGFAFSTYADAWIRQTVTRGRRRLRGRSYRSALDAGEGWEPPLSLDFPVGESDTPLQAVLPSAGPGPEPLAVDVVFLEEVIEHLAGLDLDAVDRAIVGFLTDPGRPPLIEFAGEVGMSTEMIRRRRLFLQRRLRTWAAA